jgi:hypothetical protein
VVDTILHNPSVLDAVKTDPEKTLRGLAADATKHLPPPAFVRDSGIYYIVVIALGLVSVAAIIGTIYLTHRRNWLGSADTGDYHGIRVGGDWCAGGFTRAITRAAVSPTKRSSEPLPWLCVSALGSGSDVSRFVALQGRAAVAMP